jgi:hypothetical protein
MRLIWQTMDKWAGVGAPVIPVFPAAAAWLALGAGFQAEGILCWRFQIGG